MKYQDLMKVAASKLSALAIGVNFDTLKVTRTLLTRF